MATKIFLVTHAVTQWHLTGKVQGHYDTVLNNYGNAMADELVNRLKDESIDLIVTSDLKRAYYTAIPLSNSKAIPVVPDLQLREGRWKVRYKKTKYPLLSYHVDFEDTNSLKERIYHAITKIADENDEKCILIVSHEGAIKNFISKIKEISDCNIPVYKGIRTAINYFQYSNGDWSCIMMNDGDFLKHLPNRSIEFCCIHLILTLREKLTKLYIKLIK